MELPDAIRQATLFPQSDLSDFPPGHPSRRTRIEGVFVSLSSVPRYALVFPERIESSRVERVVEAVRQLLRAEQREQTLWFVPEAASPEGLARRLLTLGMRPVRARWDAAVQRGTPVLTVGAGAMSRPILERLGFSIVGWSDSLLDEFG